MRSPYLKKLENLGSYYSLSEFAKTHSLNLSRLPVSIRIMLESLLRNSDGKKVREEDVMRLAHWNAKKPDLGDVPFCVARVILQDFTGVPLLVDLAAMRDAVENPKSIEPIVPVDLVVDHSVQVDRAGTDDAFQYNLEIEFQRNQERYEFLKWGQEAFKTFRVVPPGIGIVHQVNLEHLASVVVSKEGLLYPDTLVGTDSHTTMINGLGVVGWGVGGIEAEAAMLGQPVSIQTPEVVGMHLKGALAHGVTATDMTLRITEILRKEKVVGKFVEFFGEGAASLTVADRATIGNMAPEYGATMGFFPVDEQTLDYLRMTGRDEKQIHLVEAYLKAQHLFGIPKEGQIDYSKVIELDLSTVKPCIAGPKRPQDQIPLPHVKEKFAELLKAAPEKGGYGKTGKSRVALIQAEFDTISEPAKESGGTEKPSSSKAGWSEQEMVTNRPFTSSDISPGYTEGKTYSGSLTDGSIVIAAITSCTNTSNPSVMIGAGLLAKKAVARGLQVNNLVKTSLAPGSRVVTDYLHRLGLDEPLRQLGFHLVAYGCTTCIGNSGPLDAKIEQAIKEHDLVTASVLSGNRNFEARIHSSVKANFLMSPPLVVAYALAGRIDVDLDHEPLGKDFDGHPVYLREIWPTEAEIAAEMQKGIQPTLFLTRYANVLKDNPVWSQIQVKKSARYPWDSESTYIQNPPYFEHFTPSLPKQKPLTKMRPIALLGDSVTTDHISPAGAFKASSPAGKYLLSRGIAERDFNSYGSRRGNHEVMMRGTFANVRISNHLAGGKEGGYTRFLPSGEILPIYDACMEYAKKETPLILFAGKDYGMGSSRDWAAKGTALLGIRVVVAESFERIHRSNLIGMGVLPLRFQDGESWKSIGIEGDELFSIVGLDGKPEPEQELALEIEKGGKKKTVSLISCIFTPTEAEYFRHGGIMPYVLRVCLD